MKKSILKSTALVLCAGLVCCLLLTAAIFDAKTTQQTETQLRSLATALGSAYDANGDADAQASQFSRQIGGLRVTVIAKDGTVLGDSAADYKTMENHAGREELKAAEGAGVGISVRPSETLGTRLMYAAVRTQGGDYIRVAMQYNGFLRDLVSLLPALLGAGLVAFAVAAFVATRVAKTVTDPISDFTESLKNVQEGGARLEPEKYPYEELQAMAGDINRMSEEIARNMRRLEREKAKIDYILDNMNEGFVLLDTDQNILLINASACRAFGVKKRGPGQEHPARHAQHPAHRRRGGGAEKGGHVAVDMPLPDKRKGEVNISRVKPEDTGAIDGGAIIIISDVTAQRNAAKMRQDFFESASHELKTPITSIKGFAELLCSDMPLGGNKQEAISKRILKETMRMSSLISDIIMISRLESGDITFEREVLDLAAVVSECCSDAAEFARSSKVSISCTTQPCVLSASHREMSELAGNLITNAVKYNRQGGRVEVNLTNENGAPCLRVFNTGEPIAPEYAQRIFERFYRIDKGRSKAAGGTGLGLAIVKHIATNYGASVTVTAAPDGNTFTVLFPVQD